MATRFLLARPLLLASLATAASLALAQGEVYESRDAQGNVIFSDKASESAKAVKLPATNTMPEVAPSAPRPAQPADGAALSGYATLAITAPADGQVVNSPAGSLDVSVSVNPPLQAGHSLRLLLDGAPAGIPQQGTLVLEGLSRGAHTLQADVVDADGQVLQSSSTITVQIHRIDGRRIGPVRIP